MTDLDDVQIGIIGLGYVGLPLAVSFGKVRVTIGYDIDMQRVAEVNRGYDGTGELTAEEFRNSRYFSATEEISGLNDCNVYIVTVPTPIDEHNRPDLTPLRKASRDVGSILKMNDIIIFESTVFPGATEEVCVPIIEECSGLQFNQDFYCGYSPERINPGDREHRLESIIKVTSGSTPDTLRFVTSLYQLIITAGTFPVNSIKVAEAAKVIENSQRDLNIAFVNELSIIFKKLGIDTLEVLEAAETKWNFLPFRPGLVGGHCIGVDPYYLTYRAEQFDYNPQVILAGRRINDSMGTYIASEVVKLMSRKGVSIGKSKALILGIAFKENCSDFRNSKVVDIVRELETYGMSVDVHDPCVASPRVEDEYGINMVDHPSGGYELIILAVAHDVFMSMGTRRIRAWGTENAVLYDVKSALERDDVDGRL